MFQSSLYKKAVADSATLAAADSLNHLHDSLAIKALDVKVDTTVAALTKAYQTADSLLQDQIDSLDARVTKIEEALKIVTTDCICYSDCSSHTTPKPCSSYCGAYSSPCSCYGNCCHYGWW